MKKKFFASAIFLLVLISMIVPSRPAEAQEIIYSRKCCDVYSNIRCYIVNWAPIGNDCYCPYQGWGYVC